MEAVADLANQEKREWFYSALALAKKLGVPVVSTGSGGPDSPEALEAVLKVLPEIAKEAERQGVQVSLKAHVNAAVHDVETALMAARRPIRPGLESTTTQPTYIEKARTSSTHGTGLLRTWSTFTFVISKGAPTRKSARPPFRFRARGRWIFLRCSSGSCDRATRSAGSRSDRSLGSSAGESTGIAAQSRGYISRCLEEISGRKGATKSHKRRERKGR